MKKLAIFVEGHTEMELTVSLLEAICGRNGVSVKVLMQHQGSLQFMEMRGTDQAPTFALVANCACDGQVKTQIRDRYADLVRAGYSRIIGLRDVFPHAPSDIQKIEQMQMYGMPTQPIPIDMHLAIMEVESWFLDELTHFQRINPSLTVQRITAAGFDLVNRNGSSWDHPAGTLDMIYKLEGHRYRKKISHIKRTIKSIDMDEFYITSRARSPSLSGFLLSIENAII